MNSDHPGRFSLPLFVLLLSAAGFAAADHVAPSGQVTSHVNVRKSPDSGAEKVGTLRVDELATLLETLPAWRKIRLANGVEGYVNREWTRIIPDNDYEHGTEAFRRGDYQQARDIWAPLAEAGDPRAQFGLGNLYFNGLGLEKNQQAAFDWYLKSARQGYAPAQFYVGNTYKHGHGVIADESSANEWWQKAAEQGLASAQYNLGLQYWFGRGTREDRETAIRWFARAAEAGHPKARKLFKSEASQAAGPSAAGDPRDDAGQAGSGTDVELGNWIAQQSPGAFTIQVLATRDTQSLKDFMNQTPFADPVGWFRFRKSGETWYALVQGAYPTREQAQSAVNALPVNIKKSQVWIRPIADIHAIMRNN